jgi:hypothetical protein
MTPELSNTTISALVDYYFDVARDRTTVCFSPFLRLLSDS